MRHLTMYSACSNHTNQYIKKRTQNPLLQTHKKMLPIRSEHLLTRSPTYAGGLERTTIAKTKRCNGRCWGSSSDEERSPLGQKYNGWPKIAAAVPLSQRTPPPLSLHLHASPKPGVWKNMQA